MVAPIGAITVQSLSTGLTAGEASSASAPVVGAPDQRAAQAHSAATVAVAPAAMRALLEAQEHMADGCGMFTRTRTVHQIDRVIALMVDQAAAEAAANADFPLARLLTVREQLRQTFA